MSTVLTPNVPLDMAGAYVPPQRVTIFSIYPEKMEVELSRRAPVNTFTLAPGSPAKPSLLVVEDTWESNATGRGNSRILAEHTARDIVEQLTTKIWEASGPDRSYPGVAVCAGDYPTAEEIADLEQCQRRYFALLVNNARQLERDQKPKEIHEKHRLAARELGVEGEKWTLEISNQSKKKCVWCQKWVEAATRRCDHCQGFQSEADAAAWNKMHAPSAPGTPVQPPISQEHKQQPQSK